MITCASCGREFMDTATSCPDCDGMDALARALCSIGLRPGMWLRNGDSLGEVEAFITGFQHGQRVPSDPNWFNCFTRWVAARYKVTDGPLNGFSLIRKHVRGNEKLATQEFFRLLPDYIRDMRELGTEGIDARYLEALRHVRKGGKNKKRRR